MGLGNGAVFKLVPEHFPKDTGTVTGLVGALGGLGGFFPPLLLGVFQRSARRHLAGVPPAVRDRAGCCARPTSASSVPATSRGRSPCRWPRVRRSSASGPARGRRSSRPRWRRRSSSGRATCSTSTRRSSATRSRRSLRRSGSAIATRCGCSVRRRACTGVAGGRPSSHGARWPATRVSLGRRALRGVCRQRLHLPARPAPRARALADHVGLRARGGDHVPAGLGLDPLRDGPGRPAHVPHVRVRHSDAGLSRGVGRSPSSSSTGWSGRRSWSLPA